MTASLPLGSWVLIVLSVGLGLAIEVAFLRAQRANRTPPPADGGSAGGVEREGA